MYLLPKELKEIILDRPELKGMNGILRMVCRDWRDYIKVQKTYKVEVTRTLSLLNFSIEQLFYDIKWISKYAAYGGYIETVKWAKSRGYPWDESTCAYAAERGNFEVLKWARENGCPWDEDTCMYAAERGNFEVLKWARENGCPWDEDTCAYTSYRGNFEVLKWLDSCKI